MASGTHWSPELSALPCTLLSHTYNRVKSCEFMSLSEVTEIGEIDRFDGAKKLVTVAGIDPSVFSSGKFVTTLMKNGSAAWQTAPWFVSLTFPNSITIIFKSHFFLPIYSKCEAVAPKM